MCSVNVFMVKIPSEVASPAFEAKKGRQGHFWREQV
jgi:hypothetical protein